MTRGRANHHLSSPTTEPAWRERARCRPTTSAFVWLKNPSQLSAVLATLNANPTLLKALQWDPSPLESVQAEGTAVLPGLGW